MEELWDDSALIKAYEKAVNSFKLLELFEDGDVFPNLFGIGDESGKIKETKGAKCKKKRKRKRKSIQLKNSMMNTEVNDEDGIANCPEWKVGDECLAAYSGDGLLYNAEIVEICSDVDNVCVVRYSEYGNEEEQYLADLISASEEDNTGTCNHQNEYYSDTSNPTETNNINWQVSDLCVAPELPFRHYHEAVINSFTSSLVCKVTFIRSRNSHEVNVQDLKRSFDLYESRCDNKTHYNANVAPPMFTLPSSSPFKNTPQPPLPPPPPPVSIDDLQDGDESLASMLMSWYLSGYHTGYFKAVQQFKKNHARSSPAESCSQPRPTATQTQSNANPQSPGTSIDMKE